MSYYRCISIIRNIRYKECSRTAIIYKPLRITPKYLELGNSVFIYANCVIEGINNYFGTKYEPKIKIGKGTSIRQNAHITCASKILIGENCAITHNVTITDIDHTYEYPPNDRPPIKNKILVNNVKIGNRVMIFPNSVILGSSVIGEGCVIAANSVVRGEFPPYSLIGGCPAKILKRYNGLTKRWEKPNI